MIVLLPVGRVNADKNVLVIDAVHHDVVNESPLRIQKSGVLSLPVRQPGDIVAGYLLDHGKSVRANHFNLAHVADVKDPNPLPDCQMFLEGTAIVHGHLPTRKIHHPRTILFVKGI